MTQICLRPATYQDTELVFRWRNDPFIMVRGSSQRFVEWAEHIVWFRDTLRSARRKIFIVLLSQQPIGQIRFDKINDNECVVSVYLLQEFTGRGLGVETIDRGCQEICKLWGVSRIIACVRSDNTAARSAFLKVGFLEGNPGSCCPPAHFMLFSSGSKSSLERI
jgi:RimJ/RimL family protein N-acetyltransferase